MLECSPLDYSTLLGVIVPPIRIPVKDCEYKGEHPNLGYFECFLGFMQI